MGDSHCTFLRGRLPSGLGNAIIRRMSGGGSVPESFANTANRGTLIQDSRRGCNLVLFSQEARVRMYVLQQQPCGLKSGQKRLREGAATLLTKIRGLESKCLYRIPIHFHAKGTLFTATKERYDGLTADDPDKANEHILWYSAIQRGIVGPTVWLGSTGG